MWSQGRFEACKIMAEKYKIKSQYAAWVAAATLGTVAVLTAIHLWREVQLQNFSLNQRAHFQAQTIAKSVQDAVAASNTNAFLELLKRSLCDQDVLYVRVLGANGAVLFGLNEQKKPQSTLMVTEPIETATGTSIGEVEVGYLETSMTQRLLQIILLDLSVGIVLVVVFVFGSFWVVAPVRTALQDLYQFVRRVATGEARGERLDSDLEEVDAVAKELSDLMRRVEEAQARQVRAQKELKSAQKEMDEYTYVISHDLKEPLRGIEGFSRFLTDKYRDKLDEEGKHFIDRIRSSALRMQRLINDLLKFSRMSQQRHPMELVGFNSLLMHVRANLQFAIDAKKVELQVDKLPMVVCDATAMNEVFHNLISNAIKYNDKTVPIIQIGCTEKPNPETGAPEYEFFVRDNGLGIKAEYFNKIFQIFQRLQRDDKPGGEEGTGIGLTIVRRVIEWHGGRIWPESIEGQGTTFYFTLPKREATKSGTIIEMTVQQPKDHASVAQSI
jgi:signal transduction histidine kinase